MRRWAWSVLSVLGVLLLSAIANAHAAQFLQLTECPYIDGMVAPFDPTISADGSRIVFVGADGRVWGVCGDGANLHAITPVMSGDASISDDGTRIVFASQDDPLGSNPQYLSQVFAVYWEGNGMRQLTHDDAHGAGFCRISGDGTKIAYASWHDVFIIDWDGTNQRQLTNNANGNSFPEEITMDRTGSVVVFACEDDLDGGPVISGWVLWLSRSDGTGLHRIFAQDDNTDAFCVPPVGSPTLSDDGLLVSFAAPLSPPCNHAVYVVSSDGTGLRQLTWGPDHPGVTCLQPSMDGGGKRIAFAGLNGDYSLWLMNTDGTGLSCLIPDWHSGTPSGGLNGPAVLQRLSRDGSCLVFTSADDLTGGNPQLAQQVFLWREGPSLAKSADTPVASPGGNITFTITAQGGATGAQGAIVTDPLVPQLTFVSATGGGSYDGGRRTVTWALGDLAAGASASVTVTAQASPAARIGTQITNQAVLSCSDLSSVSAEASVFVATTEPQYPTNFWDASLSSILGADLSVGVDAFGKGVDAGEIGIEGEHKTGGRYELQHADAGDVLTIRRINGGGLTISGDLLSVDAGVVQGSAAAAEVGLSVLEERAYRFDRAFGDATSDAEVLKQDQVITTLTLANLAEMCGQDPLTKAVTGFLDNLGMDRLAAGYRYQTKTDIAGEASAGLGELGLGTSNVEVTGSLPDSALGADRGFEWYHQETLAPTSDEPYAHEYGSTVAFSGETPFSALGQSCGTGSLSVGLDKDASSTVTNYFMEAGAQNTITTSLITEDAAEQTIRFDIPPSSLSSVLASLSGGLFADLASSSTSLVAQGPADRAAQFDELHDALLTASSSQSDPVANYGRSSSTQRAYNVGFTIDPGLSLGLGAHLKLGLSASALVGQEAKTEDGQIQGGSQQPTVIYTNPQPPAYSGASGFGDMMAGIGKSALVGSWSQLWDSLPHVWDTIQGGVDKILQAASPLGSEVPEGATQVLVHGASFASSITASLYSTAADLGSMVFGGAGASPAGIVLPYRSRRLGQLQLRTAAMPTPSATLTLVGRVHVVTAADSTGASIDSFPAGGMVFQSTATAQQLQSYGFPASALSSVRLYHFLPDTVSWAEVPSTQQLTDTGVTVTGDLSEAGDYAVGILNTGATPTGACVVNMTPLSGQMCSAPTVHVEAIFNSPAGMNPATAALQADGSEVTGATATLSGAGLYLDVAGDVTLTPGPHRARVWASDLAGLPGFGTALFYVQRENTFPDVLPDFWAWRQVEATKLSGIVAGYPDGTYQPGTAVTRDQMAVYIARALTGGDAYVPTGPATADFPDVPTTYWAYKYIEYAKSMNVVVGYPDGTYQPDTVVTRDQMAVYISRAVVNPTGDAGLQGYTPPAMPSFPDVLTSNWAYEYIEYAKAQGIVAGYPDGTYQPGVTVTRDQMAVYVARAFQLAM